jgi:hypothetical protein
VREMAAGERWLRASEVAGEGGMAAGRAGGGGRAMATGEQWRAASNAVGKRETRAMATGERGTSEASRERGVSRARPREGWPREVRPSERRREAWKREKDGRHGGCEAGPRVAAEGGVEVARRVASAEARARREAEVRWRGHGSRRIERAAALAGEDAAPGGGAPGKYQAA